MKLKQVFVGRREDKGLPAFTLIELLIVVAIIAILAAIAVPNFLEAQTRAKVSRAAADMRTVAVATASYLVDHQRDPDPSNPQTSPAVDDRMWWGFSSPKLTSPVAYLTTIPVDIFPDTQFTATWRLLSPASNRRENQPYMVIARIKRTGVGEYWPLGTHFLNSLPPSYRVDIDPGNKALYNNAPSVIFSAGPDGRASLPWMGSVSGLSFAVYDPTNGTVSGGDITRVEN
jgi:prepilin-type N-terminal cleavage/methylation domain-containing protein